jgi:hypothetical protein
MTAPTMTACPSWCEQPAGHDPATSIHRGRVHSCFVGEVADIDGAMVAARIVRYESFDSPAQTFPLIVDLGSEAFHMKEAKVLLSLLVEAFTQARDLAT